MEQQNISITELKNLFISLAIQVNTIIIVVSESDLRRILNVEWCVESTNGPMVKVQVSDNAGLPSSEHHLKTIINIETKDELIKFFTDIRMMKLERWTIFN